MQAQAEKLERERAGEWTATTVPHSEYQTRPLDWIVEKLSVPRHTMQWSLNPEYQHCTCQTEICQGGGPHVWDGDVDPLVQALEAMSRGQSVAISSGTTTGKTFVIGACGTLWFMACFMDAIVISLAPKQALLLKNMWKEIGRMWPRFKKHFPDATLLTGELRMNTEEGQSQVWTASAFGAGVGADEEVAQKLKGFHSARMLFLLEELPGIEDPILNTVIKTATATFNPIVGYGQPEHRHDTLAAFGRNQWVKTIRISALDFPNVVCDREVIPGGRSRESIRRDLAQGDGDTNHYLYLSQVRGIAPEESKHALVRREWCEAAAKRWGDQELRDGPLALGADVADKPTGDRCAVSRWQGSVCTEVVAVPAEDASDFARKLYSEIMDADNPVNLRYVGIDSVGVGASAVNELKRLGVRVRMISGGMRAAPGVDVEGRWLDTTTDIEGVVRPTGPIVVEAERYANTRVAVFWRLREDLRLNRIGLPNDPMLFDELTAIEYEDQNGKLVLDKKEKVKVRLGRSPDLADALAYGNWVRARGVVRGKTIAVKPEMRTTSSRDYGLEIRLTAQAKRDAKEKKRLERALARLTRRGHS